VVYSLQLGKAAESSYNKIVINLGTSPVSFVRKNSRCRLYSFIFLNKKRRNEGGKENRN
jgi:hypothetical protein